MADKDGGSQASQASQASDEEAGPRHGEPEELKTLREGMKLRLEDLEFVDISELLAALRVQRGG